MTAGEWDAPEYDRVSRDVQLDWGKKLIEERAWRGNEIVMDAGAGSGNLTAVLASRLPHGMVYAVDADPNMVHLATQNLARLTNVKVILASMDSVTLPTGVDVVFSNAALHWMPDLEKTLSHFWELLNAGGELLIECGGHGNVQSATEIAFELMKSGEFRDSFVGWVQAWHFPKPEEIELILRRVGFQGIELETAARTTVFSDRDGYAAFVKTVIMKPFLGRLEDRKKDEFLLAFLEKAGRLGSKWQLEYVRLKIRARK